MKTIYKYPLEHKLGQTIHVPALWENGKELTFAEQVLKVEMQNGEPYIWVLVNTDCDMVSRRILIKGTGHDCADIAKADYIGTFQVDVFVWHVFAV